MIVCIFGSSCAGKSTAANLMAADLSLPVRSCGIAVRDAAKSLGFALRELPVSAHLNIDEETVSWALKMRPCIVEGRFLDQVLYGLSEPIFSVHLTANANVRLRRACSRGGDAITMQVLDGIDRADQEFRRQLYGGRDCISPSLTVDTSESTVEECVNQLKTAIADLVRPHT